MLIYDVEYDEFTALYIKPTPALQLMPITRCSRF